MIANETTLYKRPNDREINKYRSPHAFNNEQSLYCIASYNRPQNYNVKQFKQA